MTSQLTPAQIFSNLKQTVEGYIVALDNYSDEQFAHKSAEGVWSLGQMYEHLSLSASYFFMANALRCLEQRKGQVGGDKNQYGDNLYKYNGFPSIKIRIPNALQGPEPIAKTRAEYMALLKKVIADAEQLILPVTNDPGEYKCIQPAFGWLNAHEWYHLMEMHFRHHLRQQAELITLIPII
jgi:DinB superfamily